MTDHDRDNGKKLSLNAQIEHAERQLQARWQSIEQHRLLLSEHVRRTLTSPAALLSAAGIGFIVGDLTRGKKTDKPQKETSEKDDQTEDRDGSRSALLPLGQVAWSLIKLAQPFLLMEMEKWLRAPSEATSAQASEQAAETGESSKRFQRSGSPTELT